MRIRRLTNLQSVVISVMSYNTYDEDNVMKRSCPRCDDEDKHEADQEMMERIESRNEGNSIGNPRS